MTRMAFALALITVLVLGGRAQESVSLTTPIVKPSTSTCHLSRLNLDVDNAWIRVELACNNGDTVLKVYDATTSPTGAALLSTLNRANFTTNSLIKAVYTRLIADGVLVGTVSGTPQ